MYVRGFYISYRSYAMKVIEKRRLNTIRNRLDRRANFRQGAGEGVVAVGEDKSVEKYAEIEILRRLSHRNLVKLYEVIDDPSLQSVFLIMEYLPVSNGVGVGGGGDR